MSEIDDIDDSESGGELLLAEGAIAAGVALSAICLACGAAVAGPFCSGCGQKNDDLRRSTFQLAKDFMGDTFGFDSRMWRTLGTLASSPGRVSTDYAHGKRSRFTPPVRLFLVVSFLFFLTIGVTNTLFVGLEVKFKQPPAASEAADKLDEPGADGGEAFSSGCSFQGNLRFLVKEEDLATDMDRMDACIERFSAQARENTAAANETAQIAATQEEVEQATAMVDRIFGGLNWAVANPREFNESFNDWLPRVLLAMTPVLALILTIFLRRGALVFDHLVLSFYSHAVGFATIGLSLILAQFGAPYMGYAAFVCIGAYYLLALKKAYGRGWVKTVWTALISGGIYLFILLAIIITIMSNIVWRSAA